MKQKTTNEVDKNEEWKIANYQRKIMGLSVLKTDDVDNMFEKLIEGDQLEGNDNEVKGFGINKFDMSKGNQLIKKRKHELKKNVFRIKADTTDLKYQLNKLQMIARLKLTVGPLYIVTLIEISKALKSIFVNEITLGREIRIPDKLILLSSKSDCNDLPLSLQFYDYISIIIKKQLKQSNLKMSLTQLMKA